MRPTVVIVQARCARTRALFGLRMEARGAATWLATWAFRIRAETARREGWDRTTLRGEFGFAPGYPGCPACEAQALAQCGCGRLGCWAGAEQVTCPWCGATARVEGTVSEMAGGVDR